MQHQHTASRYLGNQLDGTIPVLCMIVGIERTVLAVPAGCSLFLGRHLGINLRVQLIEHALLLSQVRSKSVDIPIPLRAIFAFQLHRVPDAKFRKLARINGPDEDDGDSNNSQCNNHPHEQTKQKPHTFFLCNLHGPNPAITQLFDEADAHALLTAALKCKDLRILDLIA